GGDGEILTSPAQEPPAAVGLRHACLRAAVSYRAARGESSHPSIAAKQKTPSNRTGFCLAEMERFELSKSF
ncbi:MAG TPA: hypothetical protein DCM61_04285, partial [Clostridiales bacterium]|nr:hypothetical protein [Clostridiales bacterium]